ncbi:sulfotransferase domain-containing protein [uncultured Roseobacter sp.]|uniref:sulfotransferase family protein n=1 Tax=uncultured Roseobacter sp. TaxID=114847 RepID=UPI00263166B7|nr:sulfotransferase domain-containing protein [uncultured Roseobacter sp.]
MKVDMFHIGPQKTATTWFFDAIRHHPDVAVPPKDSVHYFDMHYLRGEDWYHGLFPTGNFTRYLDPTPSHIRDHDAAKRIHAYNPDARIIISARHPVERAFSHYWHEKKKLKIGFSFEEVFENYDLFDTWVLPGMYAGHYRRYAELFGEENVFIGFFDDVSANPQKLMDEICDFVGISRFERPDLFARRVNVAGERKSKRRKAADKIMMRYRLLRSVMKRYDRAMGRKTMETLADVDDRCIAKLYEVFEPDILDLERISGRDLSAWRSKKW